MIVVSIRDSECNDVEISCLTFSSRDEADEKMPQVFDDLFAMLGSGSSGCYGVIVADDARSVLLTDDVRSVLQACGTDSINDDTCGVCHKHFAECEEDISCVGDDTDQQRDIPTGRMFTCPGARARRVIANKPLTL